MCSCAVNVVVQFAFSSVIIYNWYNKHCNSQYSVSVQSVSSPPAAAAAAAAGMCSSVLRCSRITIDQNMV